jgi:hypothetical protein
MPDKESQQPERLGDILRSAPHQREHLQRNRPVKVKSERADKKDDSASEA